MIHGLCAGGQVGGELIRLCLGAGAEGLLGGLGGG